MRTRSDPFLFRATLRENLLVARPDADDELIECACRRANAWEFIERLPRGLDTPVAEGGSTLSGGQRQRLAIARALMRECGYFIFDEATSALDTVSERMIRGAVEQAWTGRTAVLIAHRLSTVRICDRVIVLEMGRVVQDGTYEQLMNAEGLFRRMVQTQSL
jgi:ABC-type multidrug transport system fused ATPase/permease subunit